MTRWRKLSIIETISLNPLTLIERCMTQNWVHTHHTHTLHMHAHTHTHTPSPTRTTRKMLHTTLAHTLAHVHFASQAKKDEHPKISSQYYRTG